MRIDIVWERMKDNSLAKRHLSVIVFHDELMITLVLLKEVDYGFKKKSFYHN